MDVRAFETIAREEVLRVPPRFAHRVENVVILIEDVPSAAVCREEGLGEGETLLGLYHGVPAIDRGVGYSGVLPDTITLYRLPLLEEAEALAQEGWAQDQRSAVRLAIRETLWHELGHHFGLSEEAVEARESAGTNRFDYAHQRAARVPARGIIKGALRSARGRTGRVTSLMVSMAKTLALIFGIVFVLVGLLGFVGNPLVGANALFEADTAHNLVHFALGLVLLAVALWASAQSAMWLKIVGIIYLVVGALGLVLVSDMGSLLGIISINSADNWLHLVLGVILLASSYMAKGEAVSNTPVVSSMPPTAPPPGRAM